MFLNCKTKSPWTKLLVSILAPIFLLCIWSVGEYLFDRLSGVDTSSQSYLLITQSVSSIFILFCGALLSAFLISDKPFSYLCMDIPMGGKNGVPWKIVIISCFALLAILPFVSLTTQLNESITLPDGLSKIQHSIEKMEKLAEEVTNLMVTGKSLGTLLIAILVMAILPGICEEVLFRGLLQNVFKNITKSTNAAVWITAALFSFIHFQFLGFIPRMILGAVLGYLLAYTGSVWVNATAHSLNNFLAVIILWTTVNYPELTGVQSVDMDKMPIDEYTVTGTVISTVLCLICFYFIRKYKMENKKNIAIVCGGYSSEFEVSLRSAAGIKSFIDAEKYNTTIVVITKTEWYAQPSENEKYAIDRNNFGYTDGKGVSHTFDFAYITIHGTPGENGILQGYFELIGIKYSCCGPLAASLSFNKFACNRYLNAFGAKIAKSVLLRTGDKIDITDIVGKLGLPMFVKSNVGGSSFGVTKVKETDQILPAINRAFDEGDEVIIESFLKGTEITCGMYKTKEKTVVFPITEVLSQNEFFDYNAKYNGQVKEITPARISPELTKEVQEQTAKYYSILGCKGIVRIDYIITEDGVPHVLEANTTPGMTATSFVPQQVRAAGLDIKDVMTDIIENELKVEN